MTALGYWQVKKIIENTGFSFQLVAGDCEQMPFKNECFDIAFGSQVLHHAEDLNKMVSEVARVTKKEGAVLTIGDAKRGLFQSEEKLKKLNKAVAYGVNEHFPSYFKYVTAFKKSGLTEISVFPSGGWDFWGKATEEAIKNTGNLLKRYAYKCAYRVLRIPLVGRIIAKSYLIFLPGSISIVAKKK